MKKNINNLIVNSIDENITEMTDKIGIEDIQSNIEYLKNMKKNNKTTKFKK